MKLFVASLGDDEVWKKLGTDEEPDHTFISDLVEQVMDLVGTVRSDKAGGLTGYIDSIMPTADFARIPGFTAAFIRSDHPGDINYDKAPACTTINQQNDRRYEHQNNLHVFEMEQMIETKMKKHIMSCFEKDIYIKLKHNLLGYTNVTVEEFIKFLYAEYGKKQKSYKIRH